MSNGCDLSLLLERLAQFLAYCTWNLKTAAFAVCCERAGNGSDIKSN